MQDIFKKLNDYNHKKIPRWKGLKKSYFSQLFGCDWFLANLSVDEQRFNNPRKQIPQNLPTQRTEREKVLDSFRDFANSKKINDSVNLEIEGDQRVIISDSPVKMDIKTDVMKYLSEVEKCQCCGGEMNSLPTKYIDNLMKDDHLSSVKILFVGDYPRVGGEDIIKSFSSDGGEIFKRMLNALNFPKEQILVSYLIKCLIPANDNLMRKEVGQKCLQHLKNEIYLFAPRVVVSFGAFVTELLLGRKEKMADIHGKVFHIKQSLDAEKKLEYDLVPIFHPEYLLLNPAMKKTAWTDLKKVIDLISQEK